MTGLQWLLIVAVLGVITKLVVLCAKHLKPDAQRNKPMTDDEVRQMIKSRIKPPSKEALALGEAILTSGVRLDILLISTLTSALATNQYGKEEEIESAVSDLVSALHLTRWLGELPEFERACVINALDELRQLTADGYGNEENKEILECAARLLKAKHALKMLDRNTV